MVIRKTPDLRLWGSPCAQTAWLLLGAVIPLLLSGCWQSSSPTPRPSGTYQVSSQSATNSNEEFAPLPNSSTHFHPALVDEFRNEDPTTAGWESEAFHAQADTQLKHLSHMIADGEFSTAGIEEIVSPEIQFSPLQAAPLDDVYFDDTVTLRRARHAGVPEASIQGTAALTKALPKLAADFPATGARRAKFKGVRGNLAEPSETPPRLL